MMPDTLREWFGTEYPDAVLRNGIRIPLHRESRFTRSYYSSAHRIGHLVSRFMDGSASITASELQQEWHTWKASERMDFCQSCCSLHEQRDYPDILRFVMQHGSPDEWSGIASSVASQLPCDEAFDILIRALRTMEVGRSSNIGQAIAITKHPDAKRTIRAHLETIWAHGALWDNDKFLNWIAFDATTCIAHLIELGVSPSDLEGHVHKLAEHSCARNRDSCRNYLSKHYTWLR